MTDGSCYHYRVGCGRRGGEHPLCRSLVKHKLLLYYRGGLQQMFTPRVGNRTFCFSGIKFTVSLETGSLVV